MQETVEVISTNAGWSTLPIRLIKGIAVVATVAFVALALLMSPLTLKELELGSILGLFIRLTAIAIFIERAVEVLVTPWRGLGSQNISARVKQAKAKLDNGAAGSAVEMSIAEEELREYKDKTRQMAFVIALALGLAVSAVGFRSLDYFVSLRELDGHPRQLHVFYALDALVTGTLLAGKADGLHKMISGLTALGQTNK